MATKAHCDICDAVLPAPTKVEIEWSAKIDDQRTVTLRGEVAVDIRNDFAHLKIGDFICAGCLRKYFLLGKPTLGFPLLDLMDKLRGAK